MPFPKIVRSGDSLVIEPRFIVEYLVQLMQNGTGGITNNKALVYLNLTSPG